ncbi:MAG TPA: ATP-binding cassette domain-containing protein [Acidimicrobiales bacterium]|nr:ATP-binding cassette domain-containing protein [Acidimicrobiales bacterium]
MATTSPAITTNDLRKSFPARKGPVEAVRGVSVDVSSGEIFGLLGPNGAGKTTTLRMLTTLLPIDAGSARVAGFDVVQDPHKVRERIGYVSQLGGADELATGRENLVLQGRLYGATLADIRPRVDEVAATLDLSEFADRRVKTYSGGQRRRLDVALGIVHQPTVLFLDEPTTGLDPQNRANLWDHLRALRDRGTTVVLTTHYLEEADVLCDRIVIVDHGRVVAKGTPRELKRRVAGDAVVITVKDGTMAGEHSRSVLGRQPYVREITAEGDQLRLYVEDGSAALPQLLRLLDQEQIAIRSMSLSEPTLDDVFLRQTGRSLRDGGPGDDPGDGPDNVTGDSTKGAKEAVA